MVDPPVISQDTPEAKADPSTDPQPEATAEATAETRTSQEQKSTDSNTDEAMDIVEEEAKQTSTEQPSSSSSSAAETTTAATTETNPVVVATIDTANDKSTASTTATTVTATQQAMSKADALNQSLLQSDQERTNQTLTQNNDKLSSTCQTQQTTITNLQLQISQLQSTLLEKEAIVSEERRNLELEKVKVKQVEERGNDAVERMARLDVEGDSLRQEISRLSNTNTSLNTQLSELTSSQTLTTTSQTPLQYEITRLKSELESLNSHTKWLEQTISERTTTQSNLKKTHASQLASLTRQYQKSQSTQKEIETKHSLLSIQYKSILTQLEINQKSLLEKERLLVDTRHELQVELLSERNLVSLKNDQMVRMEERYNDVVREMESMKQLSIAAVKEHEDDIEHMKLELEKELKVALEECVLEHEGKLEEMKKDMELVILEKTKLEDMLMSSGSTLSLTIGDGSDKEQLSILGEQQQQGQNQSQQQQEQGPLTLTKLYDKLADKDQELRHEKTEKRKVELYLDRIHQDFERIAPQQRQQRREYEQAMKQMGDMQNRIKEAVEETNMVREECTLKERESRQKDIECQELRLENQDLARQVQLLLKKSMGDENGDLAIEIQNQNQQLLKEYHRFSSRVKELEEELESNSVQLKLRDALSSLKQLEEERENQATLVSSIVQQRDLYRALLAKNDSQILAAAGGEEGGSTAIVAAKDQIEKYTEVESKNKQLNDMISKLNADLLSATNIKQGLEERLKRLDVHAADLSQNANKLQNELLTAHAATARSNAEASFQMQKVMRLAASNESANSEVISLNESKKDLQRLNGDLQSMISQCEATQVKIEENLRQAEVKLRLSEAKVQSLQAAETRLSTENNSLRSELSRHVALQDSMRKIESGISARSTEERDRLDRDIQKANEELATVKRQHALEMEKLQNELSSATMKLEGIGKSHQESLQEVIKAKNDAISAQSELKEITAKCTVLEKALNAAKIQLGDVDVDLSEQDKLQAMTSSVERLKEELEAANKKAEDYQKMAKASEATLAESTKASVEYKKNTTIELEKLQKDLLSAKDNLKIRQDALEGITEDLSKSRVEQEKSADNLKTKIETLKTELDTAKSDRDSWKSQVDDLSREIKVHQVDVRRAKDNYERELALHADARKELQEVRGTAVKESSLHQGAKLQLQNMTVEVTKQENAFNETMKQMEQSLKDLERQLAESGAQNKILHNQLATMGEKVEQIQGEKISKASQGQTPENDDHTSEELISSRKQIAELREVVNYMRSEREISDTQLQSARLSSERERAAGEILKKSLAEARSELEILQNKLTVDAESIDTESRNSLLSSELKQAKEQLVLLRESNTLLREEGEKLDKKVQILKKEIDDAKNAAGPSDQKCRELEVDKAALDAEKASLMREVDVWKERVTSLVSKFHQIDPEEHAKALADAKESKKECAKMKTEKETIQRQISGVKITISRLNKDVTRLKSLSETYKAALDKSKTEIETLKKKNTSATSEKEVNELKESKKSMTQDLINTRRRVDNLSEMLKRNKKKHVELIKKLQEACAKEEENKSALVEERLSHQALRTTYEALKTAMKEMKDTQEPSVAPKEPSSVVNSIEKSSTPIDIILTPADNAQQKDPQSTSVTTEALKSNVKSVLPVPKVPVGGFNFAASDPSKSKATGMTKKVQEKAERTDKESLPEGKPKELLAKPTQEVDKIIDKTSTTKSLSSVSKTSTKPKDSSDSTKMETKVTNVPQGKKNPLPMQQKTPAVMPTTVTGTTTASSLVPKDTNKSAATPVTKPAIDSSVGMEQSKPAGSGGNTPTINSQENNLREKLMKRKRELKKKIEGTNSKKAAISSHKDTPAAVPVSKKAAVSTPKDTPTAVPVPKKAAVSTPKDTPTAVPVPKKAALSSGSNTPIIIPALSIAAPVPVIDNTQKSTEQTNPSESLQEKKGSEKEDTEDKVEPKSTADILSEHLKTRVKPTVDVSNQKQHETKKDASTPMFGSGKAPVFGSGLNMSAKPFAPSGFGGGDSKTESTGGGGAFLDLKPPGTGQPTQFVFGSSSKIQLPTPSKSPSQPSPFGGVPFGTKSVFGSSLAQSTKKRALEPDDNTNNESSSNKLTRVDDVKENKLGYTGSEKVEEAENKEDTK